MQNIFQLSIFYFLYLLKKRVVINCILILLVLGFLSIPNKNANYVTIYFGDIAALANQYWIGNLASIFSNIIISFLLLFVVLGERENEILQNTYALEDSSPIKKIFKNSYKILGLYFISIFFLFVLNLSLIIANFKQINLLYFILPILYFSVSYLFILSVFTFLVEYFIKKRLKYIVFFTVFFLALFCNKYLIDLFGIQELYSYLGLNEKISSDFVIGYMPKSSLSSIIEFNKVLMPKFIYKKVLWILIAFIIIILISKKNISRKITIAKENILVDENIIKDESKIRFTKKSVAKTLSYKTLFLKDFYLFTHSFSKKNIVFIGVLWASLFLIQIVDVFKILLPLIFLSCLFINGQFLCKLHYYNLGYLETMAPFNQLKISISKFLIVFAFYTILLIPYFIKIETHTILLILFNFLILSTLQILISNYFKNNILLDVILISIFASYLTGTPIINILYL